MTDSVKRFTEEGLTLAQAKALVGFIGEVGEMRNHFSDTAFWAWRDKNRALMASFDLKAGLGLDEVSGSYYVTFSRISDSWDTLHVVDWLWITLG